MRTSPPPPRPIVRGQKVTSPSASAAAQRVDADVDGDVFERRVEGAGDREGGRQQQKEEPKGAQISTKRNGFAASTLLFGAEIAVKVNHVDPLNEGRRDVKLQWVADGEHGVVDIESVLLRKRLGNNGRFEVQGPALSARSEGEGLPLKARFVGLAVSGEMSGDMPHDSTPPRVEVKVEVKLTDKSVASLASLAGVAGSITDLTAKLSGTSAAAVVGDVLLAAIPVVSGAIAVVSARRAYHAVKDKGAPIGTKALAIGRAIADATCVVFPIIGTIANIGLVASAVAMARWVARKEARSTTKEAKADPQAGP